MNAPTTNSPVRTVPRSIGLHGRLAVLSAMAGGLILGGVLVAAMTLAGRLSGHAIFATATVLFLGGALAGLVHGAVLAFLGRPTGVTVSQVRSDMGRAALYLVPGMAVAWLVTIWVSMTLVALYTGRMGPLVGAGLGWVAAGTILTVAAVHALRALRNAYARWPERRAGTVLAGAAFAALLVLFLADRPEIWGIRLRLTEVGAVGLAALVSVWVAGPLVTLSLRLARSVPFPRPLAGLGATRMTTTDLAVGLAVGLVVGLVAVPFAGPATSTAPVGTLVIQASQALVNEMLLRLFVLTAAAWTLLRWHRIQATEAVVGAVAAAALVQVLIYAPGASAIGFASTAGTVGFLAMVVGLPALAFGYLFWKRGFGTALLADVAALAMIALLA